MQARRPDQDAHRGLSVGHATALGAAAWCSMARQLILAEHRGCRYRHGPRQRLSTALPAERAAAPLVRAPLAAAGRGVAPRGPFRWFDYDFVVVGEGIVGSATPRALAGVPIRIGLVATRDDVVGRRTSKRPNTRSCTPDSMPPRNAGEVSSGRARLPSAVRYARETGLRSHAPVPCSSVGRRRTGRTSRERGQGSR